MVSLTRSRKVSPNPGSRASNQSRACWRSSAASAERSNGPFHRGDGGRGLRAFEVCKHVAPWASSFRILIEGLEPVPQDSLDFRRDRVALLRVGASRLVDGRLAHAIRLRPARAGRNPERRKKCQLAGDVARRSCHGDARHSIGAGGTRTRLFRRWDSPLNICGGSDPRRLWWGMVGQDGSLGRMLVLC